MRKLFFGKTLYLMRLRLAWLGLIFLICFIFLWLKIVPGGAISYTRDYSQIFNFGQGFIYNFTPQDRVIDVGTGLPKITGDPVYFSVFTPRPFSRATLTVSYYRHLNQKTPIIEAGVLADNIVWRYNLQPIENRIIDSLKSSWHILSEVPLILLLNDNYQDKDNFLADLKSNNLKDCDNGDPISCLAVYNYDIDVNSKFSFTENEKALTIDVPLRGAHSLYVYVSKPSLDFNVEFVDLNLDKDPDPISMILYQGKEIISRSDLPDLNNLPSSEKEEIKKLSLSANKLAEGVYKLEIKMGDDVVIKKIESSTNRLVFSRKIWPVSYNKNIEVYTDANYLFLKALGPASLQNFSFGGQDFSLNEPYLKEEYNLVNNGEINKIVLEKDDVILENSGVFSFSKDTFFNPQLKRVDNYFEPTADIKYIVADYKSPEQSKDARLVQSVEFDMTGVYREKGRYNFAISIPNLEAEDDTYLEIEKMDIKFSGRTIWQKLFNL
ncbi:MAG TPA: hypothetical protein VFD51_02870 [Patescibacteria group bacterium]|nr:hypothetical protein [Patescibacteria group bacterium]